MGPVTWCFAGPCAVVVVVNGDDGEFVAGIVDVTVAVIAVLVAAAAGATDGGDDVLVVIVVVVVAAAAGVVAVAVVVPRPGPEQPFRVTRA